MSSSYKSCSFSFSLIFKTELEDAADLVLFLMDHTFLADDYLALNETTFTWPDRIMPIIKMRYIYIYLQPVLANCVSLPFLVCNHVTWRPCWWSIQ